MEYHQLAVKMVGHLMLLIMNKTGLICDGNNLDEIYSSLNSIIENKRYLELGRNAREFATKFKWEKTIEIYKNLLN